MTHVKATSKSRTTVSTPAVSERLAGVAVGLSVGAALMMSLWSFAAFAGALVTSGVAGVFHGFLTAVTGI